MALIGPDGKPIDTSKAKVIGQEEHSYEAGGLRITWEDIPEIALQKSLAGAKQMTAQMVGQAALEKTGSHAVAQQEATAAAVSMNNPFQLEPAAAAVFMLLSREVEYRNAVIAFLCEKIGADPEDLPKRQWADPKKTEEILDEKEEFDNAVEEMATGSGPKEQN